MKKATREWLLAWAHADSLFPKSRFSRDILDTIAKLRAENRDLKARLKTVIELWDRSLLVQGVGDDPDAGRETGRCARPQEQALAQPEAPERRQAMSDPKPYTDAAEIAALPVDDVWGPQSTAVVAVRERIEATRADLAKAQAELAELRARIDRSVCLDSEGERIHFGARVVCGQCFDSQGQHLKNLEAEVAELRSLIDRDYVPRHEFATALEERESALSERNWARDDQEQAEAERDALKAQLADAEKVVGFVRHPWRIEHIGFTGLYDVVRSPPSGRETLGHGSYPKSIAQTCCDAANREPVDNYDLKWRVGK